MVLLVLRRIHHNVLFVLLDIIVQAVLQLKLCVLKAIYALLEHNLQHNSHALNIQ